MKFWVDMDNAPHVHVLRPLILELRSRGHEVFITARDYGQTLPLLELYRLDGRCIGRHSGKRRIGKYASFILRSLRLLLFALGKRFDAVISHGSRAVFPAAHLLRIPLIGMCDYEHAELPRFMTRWQRMVLIPSVIPVAVFLQKGVPPERVCQHPGLKEDLYIHDFQPDSSFIDEVGIDPRRLLVLVRPPATMAHYAVPESENLFLEVLQRLSTRSDVNVLLLPRTAGQGDFLRDHVRRMAYGNVFFPAHVYNGPNLIWHSDLVISGGGTMNREAASLGVPVLSIYQGPVGAVDRHLVETGRLMHITRVDELDRISITKSGHLVRNGGREAGAAIRHFIVDHIIEVARKER